MRSLAGFSHMLRWSFRLDMELFFTVPGLSLPERLQVILFKYLLFMRDCISPEQTTHQATLFGRRYIYNDRFGIGSIQRVYCSSWKLKGLLPELPIVVDVGANLGQFNLFCRHYLGAGRIVSIEPLPSCYQLLVENAERPDDCINMLVSAREGSIPFYVARDSQLSSTVCDSKGDYYEEIMVPGMPLNKLLESAGCERIDLLKIDTEGSEMEVLQSASNLLDRTAVVLVEMSIFRNSTGNMFAVGSYLESRGFRLHELVFSENVHPADVDGIFVRI